MPQLLDRSPVTINQIEIPIDLIEQETLNLLGISIVDRQDYIDDCIPQGDIRYWVNRGDTQLLGGISQRGTRFDTPWSPIGSYSTLYKAATSFLGRGEVNSAYRQAQASLIRRFATTLDYM